MIGAVVAPGFSRMSARSALGLIVALLVVLFTPLSAQAAARTTDGIACTIIGTKGKDVLKGTSRRDVICGRGGNDVIKGGGGNDVIDGGPGKDRLSGGSGKDRIYGGSGNDVVTGGKGADRLDGGPGADRLLGGSGDDLVLGRIGVDTLSGGPGNDSLNGGGDRDRVTGGPGNDALAGVGGADRLDGGSGADRISGDGGDDVVIGASGDDILTGGVGRDVVIGSTGDDDLSGGLGIDAVDGGPGFNVCDIPDQGEHQLRCAIDTGPPVVGALTPSPSVVDVSVSAKRILVSAHVTDDTGVKLVQIGPTMATRISGSARDGVWQATINVPMFINPGPRSLLINARDRVGQATFGDRPNVYTVINSRIDREMPVLTSLALSTRQVDVRSAAAPISATISVTDDLAGPTDLFLCLTRASGEEGRYGQVGGCSPMRRTSGGPQNSTWTASAKVPQGAVSGTWNVEIRISDAADNLGNDYWFAPEAYAALGRFDEPRYKQIPGGAGSFTVVGSNPDLRPPSLTSLTLSPSTVDTSHGAVRVTATISGTDDEGITGGRVIVSGRPANAVPGTFPWVDVAAVSNLQLVSGTPTNGTWQATFVVPGGTPDGTYWIQTGLSDRSNYLTYVSPGTGWESDGTLDNTPAPSTRYFVVANSS